MAWSFEVVRMKFDFREAWLAAVAKRNSILCAGVDFPEYAMGRSEKGAGLPVGASKRDYVLRYLEAVEPFVAAVKPNVRYMEDDALLCEMGAFARDKGLIFIQDSKEADIGETNDAGIFRAALRGAHAVTLAPFAGNMKEAAGQGRDRGIGLITMGLMSNPDYAKIKNMWINVSEDEFDGRIDYDNADIREIEGFPHVRFYIKQIRDAAVNGLAGIVLGAPSSKNHITPEEVEKVKHYSGKSVKLVPGIGAQGGEVSILAKTFDLNEIIANVGRALMFPNGANSGTEDWAAAAETYRDMLNELRKAA